MAGSVEGDEDSTEIKLAILSSLFPEVNSDSLFESLIAADGSVDRVCTRFKALIQSSSPAKRPRTSIGYQSSLVGFKRAPDDTAGGGIRKKTLTKKGQTLHLYAPADVAAHTPCSIIHNFLPADEADALLEELLAEAPTFESATFKLFDNVVQSPHTACFYVDGIEEEERQKNEYLYNGARLTDVRQILRRMREASPKVETAVNNEISKRIREIYSNGKKLKYQSPGRWIPNCAFANCYKGGNENVGYHSDQLTYLGPRAVIGSISLGVAREFRVRKIVAHDDENDQRADDEGQIAIHLPHNSLLVMHAEMQEEWKHSIQKALVIDPHPIAGNKRINITYRYYRETFHPKHTPKCRCGIATVLKCVQRKKENRGRYMWMCHGGNRPGKEGCSFFKWAEFDEDGEPPWSKDFKPASDTQGDGSI